MSDFSTAAPGSTPTATAAASAAHSVGATKAYGSGDTQVLALNDVTVSFPSARFTAIMGPS
ncbi:MAG: ABC transporter ATP-binding protein, partial [Microthrixaceae bacterium]|nr:ABC transporter ATP-binding protein [Microthrixaceae bacterium]